MARVDPQVKALLVERLRGLRAAGELTTEVVRLAHMQTGPPSQLVELLAGAYRVPDRVHVLVRAAHLAQRPAPAHPLLGLPPDKLVVAPKRLAHRIRRSADLTGIEPPPGARPLCAINPATPFASTFTARASVT